MIRETPPPLLNIAVACGPVPCDTEEGRTFLQDRLALFGKIGFVLSTGLYVLLNLLVTILGGSPWSSWLTLLANQLHLGISAVFAAVYFVCRTGRRSHGQLALIDALGVLVVGVLLGLDCWAEVPAISGDQLAVLAITNVLLARAITVPSSAPWTFLSGALAAVPVVAGACLAPAAGVEAGGAEVAAGASSTVLRAAVLGSWGAMAVIVSTVASYVVYGLQQEVRQAKQFGQYTLEERIGSGGMGEVFRASHALLRRPTAVKLLRPDGAGERSLARFEREVQLTSQLTHPNTIAIYDYGHTPDGTFYYAMEYLDGLNLEQLVQMDGSQPPARVIHVLTQVCASLEEAHGIDLIHRDIKPANVILGQRGGVQDVAKVVDFGLVKSVDQAADVTVSSATITGTPMYFSPEAIRSPESVNARSDLYALGALGYHLVTGQHVFDGDNFMEICGHHLHTTPVPPSRRLGKPVPHDLEGLILLCLEKSPDRRPKDARALRLALEGCEDANRWTEEDANAWWASRAGTIRDAKGSSSPSSSEATASQPLEITRSATTAAAVSGAQNNAPAK
ncbi:MAG: serine/threonine-protein kinase [Planctomycetota bacterium]|nr:serine/threonine-protein kinase [Planctomycetota bacterium]